MRKKISKRQKSNKKKIIDNVAEHAAGVLLKGGARFSLV